MHVGERLFLMVEDKDQDISDGQDNIIVTVKTTSGEKESITLTETLTHSGLFTGSFPLVARNNPRPNSGNNGIECFFGDGFKGLSLYAPYDAIMITASPPNIPEILINQLKSTGRIIMPLNQKGQQKLLRIKKNKNGILKKIIDDVFFVPMLKGTQK